MMSDAIKNFASQFEFQPKIENAGKLGAYSKFLVCGMGGSAHSTEILKTFDPAVDVILWRDYGLPQLSREQWKGRLVIASSYSGNTEETLDGFASALKKKLPLAAIAVGGKLIQQAKKAGVPYVQMPDTHIQPRSALGFSLAGLLAIIRHPALRQLRDLSRTLKPEEYEAAGKALAERLRGRTPVFYASARNLSLAMLSKIKFNETGKIPSFFNVLPELNHNEMTGFDVKPSSKRLSGTFHFIIFESADDHPRIIKRMEILEKLYRDRGLPVEILEIDRLSGGVSKLHSLFYALLVADWAALHTAEHYGLESEQVPMVEEFKKLVA